jgi:hypothetical protein
VAKHHRKVDRALDLWTALVRHLRKLVEDHNMTADDVVDIYGEALLGDMSKREATEEQRFRRKIVSLLESICVTATTAQSASATTTMSSTRTLGGFDPDAKRMGSTGLLEKEGVVMLGAKGKGGSKKKLNLGNTSTFGFTTGLRLDELDGGDVADLDLGDDMFRTTTGRGAPAAPVKSLSSQSSSSSPLDSSTVL